MPPTPLRADASGSATNAALPGALVTEGRTVGTRRLILPSLALELGVLLTLSVLFPFMVHLLPVPEDARLGPRLLPMFYAPLLAALLGRRRSAVLVAGSAPWLNWLITGHPTPPGAALTMAQLLAFVGAVGLLLPRVPARGWIALPAYLASLALATALAAAVPSIIGGRPALAWAVQTIAVGLPGIAVLLLINWLAVRNYPTGGDGGPQAA